MLCSYRMCILTEYFFMCFSVPPTIDESNVVYSRKVVENRTIIIECPVAGMNPNKLDL